MNKSVEIFTKLTAKDNLGKQPDIHFILLVKRSVNPKEESKRNVEAIKPTHTQKVKENTTRLFGLNQN